MEAAPLRELAPGTMLDDKYRIERLLAVGGMGAVYEGTHVKLRKRVAIKVLNPELASQAMVDRFHREAITASQIGHEGIAQVTDIGTSTTGEPFLVMELLEGESLAGRLKHATQLPIDVACELGCAILSPLAAAHAAGIVHRDLKPDNVFLVRQSRGELVKLLDFGISRSQGLEQEFRLTTTGLVLGTPYYMSPEQARGEAHVTFAADLYAFGVIMYEMLVGEVPIKAENYNALIYKVMTGDFQRPRARRPDIPPQLEEIVVRAMALDPTQRFASASQLEQALLQFCRATFRDHMIERISQQSMGFKSSSPLLPAPTPRHPPSTVLVSGVQKRKSKALVPIIIAAVAAGGIAGAVVLSKSKSKKPDPVAQTADPPPTPTPPQVQAVAPPPVVDDPKPVEPAKVTIKFDVEPATATITVDGKPSDATLEVVKDDAEHDIEITQNGFQPYREKLTFSETQKLVIKLDKVGQKPTAKPKPNGKDGKDGKGKTDHIDTKSPYGN